MLEALGNIGDFVGGIGVVATLGYLIVQIRQNTRQLEHNAELVQAGAELEIARLMGDWHRTVAGSPELVRIWGVLMANGTDALKSEERARLVWLIAQYVFIAEGLYRQHLRGFLAPDSWVPYEKTVSGLLQMPLVRDFFYSPTSTYSAGFRRLCERLIESPIEDGWRYVPLETFGTDGSAG